MRCAKIALVLLLCVSLTLSKGAGSKKGNKKAEPSQAGPPQYNFGDIISSTMTSLCGGVIRKHYVVYVGNEEFKEFTDKKDNQDIFHRWDDGIHGCRFGELSKGRDLDLVAEYRHKTDETTKQKMKERIIELKKDCGEYDVVDNNCEQTATYVRFKDKMSYQRGTLAGLALRNLPANVIRRLDDYIDMLDRAKEWLKSQCTDENNNH